jgi:hypothetical protein
MSERDEKPRRNGWRRVVIGALLLAAWHGAKALPEPELHMRMEVAVLVGGTGFAVALIR